MGHREGSPFDDPSLDPISPHRVTFFTKKDKKIRFSVSGN